MSSSGAPNVVRLSDHVPEKTNKVDKPEDVAAFLSLLKSSNFVDVLHLSHVSISKDVAVVLGNALSSHDELQELHMVAAFKARQIEEVVQCLEAISDGVARSGCHLRVIDISENAFRGTGIRGMSAVLTGRASFKLEVLKMSDQGLSPEGGQVLGQMLSELRNNAAMESQELVLHTFKASKNRLEDGGATALGQIFKSIKSLHEVELYQCGINANGLTNLLRGLSASRDLRFLDILDNTCNDKAETALVEAIKCWPKLEDLRINSCLISDKGMLAVLAALRTNCYSLKTLDIGENSVDGKVENEVLEHLTSMPALESIVLKGNEFYDKKLVSELFRRRFTEIGKPNAIKKNLGGGHTYNLAGDEDESDDEDEEEEGGEDHESADSDKETGEVSDETSEAKFYLLDASGDSMWTVTFPGLQNYNNQTDLDADLFSHRMEINNFFTTLGYFATEVRQFFDTKNYSEAVLRLVAETYECSVKRAESDREEQSIKADNRLDALTQFAEYLVATGSMVNGCEFFEEFFRSMGLLGSPGLTDENHLCALAWLVRHVLYGSTVPLHVIGKMDREVLNPQRAEIVNKLTTHEGFTPLFEELHRQAGLD